MWSYSTYFNVSIYEKKKINFLKILDREGPLLIGSGRFNQYICSKIDEEFYL